MIAGEKVRAAVAALCAPVTISIGAASLSAEHVEQVLDAEGLEGLISGLLRSADQAAYAAKHGGRNRVVAGSLAR